MSSLPVVTTAQHPTAWRTRYQTIDIGSGIQFLDDAHHQKQGECRLDEKEIKSIGDIVLTKTLGTGSTGKVRLGINQKTGQQVAVKIVYRTTGNVASQKKKSKEAPEARERRIMREAALLNLLKHPNIVQLYDMLVTDEFFCLFFEYVEGGQMLDYIIAHGRLKEQLARHFMRQLLSAVDYCHRSSVVHRDLKIENVLIDKDGNVKLIDFGLSNLFNPRDSLHTFCGSLYFAAPELLKGNVYTGPEVDVWSLGVIFYVLVCGKVPFDDKSLPVLHEKIKKCSFEIPSDLSPECQHLLGRMIVGDPGQRASLSEVMHHPWILGVAGSPDAGEIENYLPRRDPITSVDAGIVETICIEFGIDLPYAMQALQAAVDDWPAQGRNEIVSLYYLMMEKLRDAAVPVAEPVLPEEMAVRSERKRALSFDARSSMEQPMPNGLAASNRVQVRKDRQGTKFSMDFCHLDSLKLKSVYLKGIFSVNTTTLKTPSVLAGEIAKVLELNSIKYSLIDASFMCQYSPSVALSECHASCGPLMIQFEIELVRVAILGLLGVQFHRIFGDFKQYKNLCSHILTELRI